MIARPAYANYDAGAAAYDRLTGHWSRQFVADLISSVHLRPGARVLDLASGTGAAAEAASRAVGPDGSVIASDISLPMLGVSRAHHGSASTRYVQMDAHQLGFADGTFDAVLCQLGIMFFKNAGQALAEARRVLREPGRIGLAVWGPGERVPFVGVVLDVLVPYLPEMESARQQAFGMTGGRLRRLLREAGFRDIELSAVECSVTYEDFGHYWSAFEAGAGRIGAAYLALSGPAREAVVRAVRERMEALSQGGRLCMRSQALIAVARR